METAPIALFVYNRPEHTRRTVEALQKNNLAKESEVYFFSDGPKNELDKDGVDSVRNYLSTVTGFKKVEIIKREKNFGLAESIISGVTDIVNKFGKIIVLEDDLVTSPYFLEYMNEALDMYKNNNDVISIHGYIYPIAEKLPETLFVKGADCWGWATWKRGWDLFERGGQKLLRELEERKLEKEFDFGGNYHFTEMLKRQIRGKNNSWAVRWYASAFLKGKVTLYPGRSLVDNIGHDTSGTHQGNSRIFDVKLTNVPIKLEKLPATEEPKTRKIMENYFKSLKPGLFQRIMRKIFRNHVE